MFMVFNAKVLRLPAQRLYVGPFGAVLLMQPHTD